MNVLKPFLKFMDEGFDAISLELLLQSDGEEIPQEFSVDPVRSGDFIVLRPRASR